MGRSRMNKSILYIIVPLCSIFITFGGWGMLTALRDMLLGLQARDWPQTTGRVLSVGSKSTSDIKTRSREIRVRYAYSVGGHDYEGSTIHPAYGSSSIEQAHCGVESLLRSAQQVRVYYDGSQPSRSTLSVGFYSGTLSTFFLGFLFFAAGIAFLLSFWFVLMGDWDFARGITVVR
ncbi:MAG: hypothetical protein C0478_18960 [Planctomyces sp.]|nr:hypothetical protein [Planctomyces sp.]